MGTQTIPTIEELMQWQHATSWSRLVIQQKVAELDRWKITHDYDDVCLARLDAMEKFLAALQNELLADEARTKLETVLGHG